MIKRMWLLGLVILAGMVAAPVRAGDEKSSQPYVVLVGVDQFQDAQIKPRKFAETDIKALYDVFTSKDHLGVKADRVKLLLGKVDPKRPSEPATRANILKAMKWLEETPGKDDLVVFAYFGQGAPMGERVGYFGVDSTYKNRAKDAVAAGDLEHLLEHVKTEKLVALLDVHFLGIDPGKEPMPDANLQNIYKQFLPSDEGKTMPSRAILMANNGLKPSLDLEKHGVFAQVLLDGLRGKADKFGYEPDGNITVTELTKYVKDELHTRAVESGKSEDEKGQQPVILDSQKTDFVIDWNPAVHPKAVERIEKFGKLVMDGSLAKEQVEEGEKLLRVMPKLKAHQDLRKSYQRLIDGKVDLDGFKGERETIINLTKMTEREAISYASMVIRAAKVVRQGYVKDVPQPQLIEQAVVGLFKNINEKMPAAIEEKLTRIKGMKEADQLKILMEARQTLGKREDLDKGKDVTLSLHGMLGKLDKHTDYIDPELTKSMQRDLRGHFFGIGVQIRTNNVRDQLQVVTPIFGSPAYKKKIYAGDIITNIVREVDSNGEKLDPPETIPTKGMPSDEAVKKILGKEGTKVKLIVEREGAEKPLEFELIRGRVEVESVHGHKRDSDDGWNYVVDPANKICYVRLSQFGHNTYRDLEKVMTKLYKAGIKGFILDLRFNPGGLLDASVKISDLFIDDGMIVSIRPRNGPETSYVGKSDGSYTTFPMVCLVNGSSASASEIVSACLQDHGRAIIIGTRSYGKGSVQTIHPFETGGSLKLTTATFWRPSGRNLNRASTKGKDEDEWGVSPDPGFDIKLTNKELNDLADFQREQEIIVRPDKRGESKNEFRDKQMETALEYLRNQIRTGGKTPTAKVQN